MLSPHYFTNIYTKKQLFFVPYGFTELTSSIRNEIFFLRDLCVLGRGLLRDTVIRSKQRAYKQKLHGSRDSVIAFPSCGNATVEDGL